MIQILEIMKYNSMVTFLVVALTACNATNSPQCIDSAAPENDVVLIRSPGIMDINQDDAPIEKIILTLPVHPEMKNFFEEMVVRARENYPAENHGDMDRLYIGGDGSRGVITFWLNRADRSLRVIDEDETRIPPREG
jgi:hypothetical protein